jgi:hypothetical protein
MLSNTYDATKNHNAEMTQDQLYRNQFEADVKLQEKIVSGFLGMDFLNAKQGPDGFWNSVNRDVEFKGELLGGASKGAGAGIFSNASNEILKRKVNGKEFMVIYGHINGDIVYILTFDFCEKGMVDFYKVCIERTTHSCSIRWNLYSDFKSTRLVFLHSDFQEKFKHHCAKPFGEFLTTLKKSENHYLEELKIK